MYTMETGKMLFKKYAIFISLMVVMLSCISCSAGRGDWKYPLPNGYQVFMSNSRNIAIVGTEYHEVDGIMTTFYIESRILEFCYDDRYVAAKRQVSTEDQASTEAVSVYVAYYLLDTETGAVYGPYGLEEYEAQLGLMDDITLCPWISTRTAPKGAMIGDRIVA